MGLPSLPAATRRPSWQAALLAVGGVLLALPIWSVPLLPTIDGPCHLYNAWVMRHLHDPAFPQLAAHYVLSLEPIPNWLSQLLLTGLISVAPPLLAEKLLFTGYVAFLLGAAWYLAGSIDPRRRVNALLALPFVWNQFAIWAFYNFALSLGLWCLAVGYWWRHRERPDLRFAVGINALLLLLYFAHIVSLLMALLTLGILWLASFPQRDGWRHLRHPLLLLPQLALPIWFVRTHHSGPVPAGGWELRETLTYLRDSRVLFTEVLSPLPGRALGALFLVLVAATLVAAWRHRRQDRASASTRGEGGFPLAAVAILTLYLFSPDGAAGGTILQKRLALYPFLALLPWMRVGGRWAPAMLALALTAGAALQSWQLTALFRRRAEHAQVYLRSLEPIRAGTRAVSIIYGRFDPERAVLGHLIDYVAIEKGLIDWDNYQAATTLFPIRFREGITRPHPWAIEARPDLYDVPGWKRAVGFIHTWDMPADADLRQELEPHYRRIHQDGLGEVFRRRLPTATEDPDRRRATARADGGGRRRGVAEDDRPRRRQRAAGERRRRGRATAPPTAGSPPPQR